MTDMMSVVSEAPSVFTGKVTNAERKISQLGKSKHEELERLRQ